METFIRINKANKGMIEFIHSCPFDPVNGLNKSRDELLKEGFLVENFPEPKLVEGKRAIPYYNVVTKEVTYEYVLIPDDPDEKIKVIEKALNEFFVDYQKNNIDTNKQLTEAQTALCDIYELLTSVL